MTLGASCNHQQRSTVVDEEEKALVVAIEVDVDTNDGRNRPRDLREYSRAVTCDLLPALHNSITRFDFEQPQSVVGVIELADVRVDACDVTGLNSRLTKHDSSRRSLIIAAQATLKSFSRMS